ncbi:MULTISPECIES: LysR family transcriptional regulator [unclassified Streptomyces]|uniref:LysR family transcriptional regulator n=1 Tax=unclassified Streptomyces TaxID=2593676 RepID=UPI0021097463|nr:LysR family transcriptional regulator [Streptomyces sp. ScaeMP-e83]
MESSARPPYPTEAGRSSMDGLWFFQIVASHETLTAAARELGCSLSVVSKRLAALERRLAVRLVRRGARRMSLTSEGERYAARAQSILDQVRELEGSLAGRSAELRGSLTVESTIGLGRAHVAPLLGEFAADHPGLHAQLHTSALPLRPHRRTFDVAVHVGAPADSSLRMRRLAANRRVPCAAPSYLAEHGVPQSVEDLAGLNCIVLRENEGDYALWRFGDAARPRQLRVHGSLSSNDGDVVTDWALRGRGVIMRSEWHVAPYLRRGELVRVLPHLPTPAADIYALYADGDHVPPRVSRFVGHLASELPRRLAA